MTHGKPAFSDRSGVSFAVNPCVSFQHSPKIAKFERALPRALSEASSQRWIIKDLRKALRERHCIAGAKCESSCAEHLH